MPRAERLTAPAGITSTARLPPDRGAQTRETHETLNVARAQSRIRSGCGDSNPNAVRSSPDRAPARSDKEQLRASPERLGDVSGVREDGRGE